MALVGGGAACRILLQFLTTHSLRHLSIRILGIADPREDAPGVVYGRQLGIYTTCNFKDLFAISDLDLLIELTGRDEVLHEILQSKPAHLKVMDHLSAQLFWELIKLQEEKVQCERRLTHSNRLTSVGRMASYLAHEIRNPLVSIGGFASTLLNARDLPESLRPKAEIIVKEVRRLEMVLKSLRDYTRPLALNKKGGNFNKLVSRAYVALEHELRSSGVEMHLDLDSEMPDSLFDSDLILDALVTLARKLISFMASGQKIEIRTEVCWDSIGIYLQSQHCLISPETLENMFNPFSLSDAPQGGFDLAMCKKIINDHGGDVRITSTPKHGTIIIIELPVEVDL
ncbi:MAG: hypothetical protein JRI89_09035 [Deltaproteobacteria bacterium]|nr:hypothetical protein [Deltaproteobacteria bacterium]